MQPISIADLPDGWFSSSDIEIYRSLYEAVPEKGKTAEIGVWLGRSIISVSDIIVNKQIQTLAVDDFSQQDIPKEEALNPHLLREEIKATFLKYALTSNINFIEKNSIDVSLTIEKESLDLVFIDGCHHYENVLDDITYWYPTVKIGGCLAGHDFSFFSVKKAIAAYFNAKNSVLKRSKESIWMITKVK